MGEEYTTQPLQCLPYGQTVTPASSRQGYTLKLGVHLLQKGRIHAGLTPGDERADLCQVDNIGVPFTQNGQRDRWRCHGLYAFLLPLKPHSPQNLNCSGFSLPQLGHRFVSEMPHSPQNSVPSGFSNPHLSQCMPLPYRSFGEGARESPLPDKSPSEAVAGPLFSVRYTHL